MEFNLTPLNGFNSFFGCDGAGKSTITTAVADILGPRGQLLIASKPESWPGTPLEHDFQELEYLVRDEPNPTTKKLARLAFTQTIVRANYLKALELSKDNTTVLNDSDVLMKALVWSAIEGERIESRFRQATSLLAESPTPVFPDKIIFVCVSNESPTQQAKEISHRLASRGLLSSSDPTSLPDITKRIIANEQVYSFLDSLSESNKFTVHRVENPSPQENGHTHQIQTIAKNVVDLVS